MQFPTGGDSPRAARQIRCNSEADSTVWMKEDRLRKRGFSFAGRTSSGIVIIPEFFAFSGVFSPDRIAFAAALDHLVPGSFFVAEVSFLTDQNYMRRAIALAEGGAGWVSPNPLVGAVIVKDGQIIGEGFHKKCGDLHAERNALAACTEDQEGATMYVTLEPCCHTGRQPPCVEAILDAKLARVFIGSRDPNPQVSGKGVEILRRAGVEVITDFLREECDALNPVFFHYIQTKRPYVVMKYAMTMDGKIAAWTGASKWVTGESARLHVQGLRHRYRGIMVGLGTVLADDPLLTCRVEGGRNPVRIVCDTHLGTPLDRQLVQTAHEVRTILATCCTDEGRHKPYLDAGCTVLVTPERDGHVDLPYLMGQLGTLEIDSVLLEGGGTLNWAALESGVVNKVCAYIAPKLFGGRDAKTPVEGAGVPTPVQAIHLTHSKLTHLGEDILIESEVDSTVHGNC